MTGDGTPVGLPGRAGAELVEVVDAHGTVERVVTRAEMRAGRLRHRCTYIAVVDGAGCLVVHRRADWKDVYPGWWDLCFGGVLDAGEDWDDAARRELAEEAGVDAPVRAVGRGTYDGAGAAVVGRVYEAVHDGPYPCPDGEVVEVRTVPRTDLGSFVGHHDVCPDSVAIVLPLLRG